MRTVRIFAGVHKEAQNEKSLAIMVRQIFVTSKVRERQLRDQQFRKRQLDQRNSLHHQHSNRNVAVALVATLLYLYALYSYCTCSKSPTAAGIEVLQMAHSVTEVPFKPQFSSPNLRSSPFYRSCKATTSEKTPVTDPSAVQELDTPASEQDSLPASEEDSLSDSEEDGVTIVLDNHSLPASKDDKHSLPACVPIALDNYSQPSSSEEDRVTIALDDHTCTVPEMEFHDVHFSWKTTFEKWLQTLRRKLVKFRATRAYFNTEI